MSPVMRLLQIEHNRLRKLFDILEGQLDRIAIGEHGDFDIIEAVFSYCQSYVDRCHHPRENIVYRQLRASCDDSAGTVRDLLSDHALLDEIGRRAAAPLRGLRADPVAARSWAQNEARAFLRANRQHLDGEEEHFFPAAEAALTADDWREIDRQIAASGNPDFGVDTAKRFEILLDYIASLDRLNHLSEVG